MKTFVTNLALATMIAFTPLLPMSAQAAERPTQAQIQNRVHDMQARVRLMQEQLDKILKTKDPQEQQRLLKEHEKTMHEQMSDVKVLLFD